MSARQMKKPVLLFTIIAATISLIAAQETGKSKTSVDLNDNNVVSGAELYRMYCAVCHGTDGKGNGPAAAAPKYRPPDLTAIGRRNGGQFPEFRIAHIIDGYEITAAHGSRDMPIWGSFFHDRNRDDALLKLREHNLTEYIKSIQR
ncbi:MAG: cytochrome c [Bryobacteraceae bacterium]|jgi:mono/diheme cytochrome c family protein